MGCCKLEYLRHRPQASEKGGGHAKKRETADDPDTRINFNLQRALRESVVLSPSV